MFLFAAIMYYRLSFFLDSNERITFSVTYDPGSMPPYSLTTFLSRVGRVLFLNKQRPSGLLSRTLLTAAGITGQFGIIPQQRVNPPNSNLTGSACIFDVSIIAQNIHREVTARRD